MPLAFSTDGKRLLAEFEVLIEEGSFLEAASAGRIAAVPFGGGPSRVLVSRGSQAGWNA